MLFNYSLLWYDGMIFNPIKIYHALNSVVGMAIRYSLVRGSNPGGVRDFPHPSTPALGPKQPPIHGVPDLSWR